MHYTNTKAGKTREETGRIKIKGQSREKEKQETGGCRPLCNALSDPGSFSPPQNHIPSLPHPQYFRSGGGRHLFLHAPAGPAPQRSATGCCSRKQPPGEPERDLPRIPPGTAISRPLPRFGTSSRRLSEFAKPSAEERPARTGGRTRQPGESRRNIYRISCGDSAYSGPFPPP